MKRSNYIYSTLIFILFNSSINAQSVYVNQHWTVSEIQSSQHNLTASVIDSQGDVIVASTTNTAGNNDISITKYDQDGNSQWQQSYDGGLSANDYLVQLEINASDEIFVLAATSENANDGLDFTVIKYDNGGQLIFSRSWDSGNNGNDIPADMTIDANDNVYVSGGIETGGYSDIGIVKIKSSGGLDWTKTYDRKGYYDAGASIELLSSDELAVTGLSAANNSDWYFTVLKVNTSGTITNTQSSRAPGVLAAFEVSMAIGENRDLYLVGSIDTLGDTNVRVICLDSNLTIKWKNDYNSGNTDIGNDIVYVEDDGIYVSGTSVTANGGSAYLICKYDTLGDSLWSNTYFDYGGNEQCTMTDLISGPNNTILGTGITELLGEKQFTTFGIYPDGRFLFVKNYNYQEEYHPQLSKDDNYIYLTGIVEEPEVGTKQVVTQYELVFPSTKMAMDTSDSSSYRAEELIIRFDEKYIKTGVIDAKEFQAGKLIDFLDTIAIIELDTVTGISWANAKTYKIFTRMTSADTVSETRLGDTIKTEHLYATLLVHIDSNLQQTILDTVDSLYPTIRYAERNYIGGQLASATNDTRINDQTSLVNGSGALQNANIKMDSAWMIDVGSENIKAGVYDEAIYWEHSDFGDGSFMGSKIKGGWSYIKHTSIAAIKNPKGSHGTACAGIIGALRNNGKGIAGIAGGDVDGTGNTGVQLYSFAIVHDSSNWISVDYSQWASDAEIANAVVEGARYNSITDYGYGLHIQNHSWTTAVKGTLRHIAFYDAWKNHCVIAAARGNHGTDDALYPACYEDKMVLSVGASGSDGKYKHTGNGKNTWNSSYGKDVDFTAPGAYHNVIAPIIPFRTFNQPNNCAAHQFNNYDCFSGTSSSAPHVSGVAALMLNKHNTKNGAPNNLAPEDVEKILEKTAWDVVNNGPDFPAAAGYDQFNGWGRIDAYEALKAVEYPIHYVKHNNYSVPSITTTNNVTLQLTSGNYGLKKGKYLADKHKLTYSYTINLPQNEEIIDWWPVDALYKEGFNSSSTTSGIKWMNVNTQINIGGNTATVTAETYCWYVKSKLTLLPKINKWIPAPPNEIGYGFSLHIRDNNLVGTKETNSEQSFELYPNPSAEIIHLKINAQQTSKGHIEIVTVSGQMIKTENSMIYYQGTNAQQVNVQSLPSGFYICKLITTNGVISKSFVKH